MTSKVTNDLIEDGAVTAAKLAANAVTNANVAAGAVVQVVNTQTGAMATGATTIPQDDTIPQIGEGNEYMTLAITPKSATNKLKIDVVFNLTNSAAVFHMIAALFQDAVANALAVAVGTQSSAGYWGNIKFTHYMTAGTVSAITFRARASANVAGTTTFNGQTGARQFGGVFASSITITEIKA